jgi:hypothetical protein
MRHRRSPLGLYYKSISETDRAMEQFAAYLVQAHQIQLVHAAYPQPYASFLRMCVQLGIPYLVTATDFNLICHYSSMITRQGRFCHGSACGDHCARRCKTYGVSDFNARYINARHLLANAAASLRRLLL